MNITDLTSNVISVNIWFYDSRTLFNYIYYGKKETNDFYWVAVNFETIKHMLYPCLSKYVEKISKSHFLAVLDWLYDEVMK